MDVTKWIFVGDFALVIKCLSTYGTSKHITLGYLGNDSCRLSHTEGSSVVLRGTQCPPLLRYMCSADLFEYVYNCKNRQALLSLNGRRLWKGSTQMSFTYVPWQGGYAPKTWIHSSMINLQAHSSSRQTVPWSISLALQGRSHTYTWQFSWCMKSALWCTLTVMARGQNVQTLKAGNERSSSICQAYYMVYHLFSGLHCFGQFHSTRSTPHRQWYKSLEGRQDSNCLTQSSYHWSLCSGHTLAAQSPTSCHAIVASIPLLVPKWLHVPDDLHS